jgi:leucyl aminopeptidase
MCIADGVAYAAKDLGADVILDICTLTGAQVMTAHTEGVLNFARFAKAELGDVIRSLKNIYYLLMDL